MPSRRRPTGRYLSLGVAIALLAASRVIPASRDQTPGRGHELYGEHCADCHGAGGKGDGPTALRLKLRVRDFSHGSFKCRCTATGDLPTDDDLRRSVREGLPGTPMIGFADELSSDEIDAVVAHLKTFSKRFGGSAANCVPVPEPPAASAADLEVGRRVYQILQCWTCHGSGGRGDGPAADGLKDDWGHRSKPGRFGETGKLKCGGGERELYRTLMTGLDGTPMPSYQSAFLFGREAQANLAAIERALGAAAAADLGGWLAGEPDAAALSALAPAEKDALAARRAWALVRFLMSMPAEAAKQASP